MTQKLSLLYLMLILGLSTICAQKEMECKTKLSLLHQDVKVKNYDKAYEPWLFVYKNCPELNRAIYADGEKILEHKIKSTKGDVKLDFINMLLELWEKRKRHFSDTTPSGEYAAKACQLLYQHKDKLQTNETALYNCFDIAFKNDSQTFTHPKSLYTYFSLIIDLFDEGKKTGSELFNSYDDINDKIDSEIQNYSEKLNAIIREFEKTGSLNKSEQNKKRAYESYLKNYTLIQNNIKALVDKRANCSNLIPLYTKDLDAYQNDSIWLKRSVSRLYHKKCTENELYEKLVRQYDEVSPSADTKLFVATVLFQKGKDEEAFKYLEEAYELETRPYKKSNMAIRIADIYKDKGRYSAARKYLLQALRLNPSNGKPHIVISQMYAKSAKDCGKDNYHKRAVFWLAAKEVKKASKVDPTLQEIANQYEANYLAKAPSKEKGFILGTIGKTIKIECWINRSIVVPD
ncbi:tetratricopeptide repeat protein [uncultured Winogradskyella sp.]|uniref:tetratricopeptide repeat protein n=1 Tax=uncultured Winogradskyella sp. TaxID=395353 RepID=UPI00261114C4|nr:tetratricopeptide repeat protein [uncultured Winogradskyella sp.]